jgi:hypothetical protein
VPGLDDSRKKAEIMTDTTSLISKKATPKKKTQKTRTKTKAKQTPTKTTSRSIKKSTAKKTAPKKTSVRKTTPRKTASRKTAPSKSSAKKTGSEKKSQKALNGYLPASTDVITTPPCPECKNGYLLPYSERIEEKGKEVLILPFAKWVCSKCNYSPSASV